jgi:hypothetical protein
MLRIVSCGSSTLLIELTLIWTEFWGTGSGDVLELEMTMGGLMIGGWKTGETTYEIWWFCIREDGPTWGGNGGRNWGFAIYGWLIWGINAGGKPYLWWWFGWNTCLTLELWREGTDWSLTGIGAALLTIFIWGGGPEMTVWFLFS